MPGRFELPTSDAMTSRAANEPRHAHSCADNFELLHRAETRMIFGVEIPVQESLYRCRVCGEEEYSLDQAEAAQREAAAHYRERFGFLQPDPRDL